MEKISVIKNKKCSKCGFEYNEELKRCPNCGEPNSIAGFVFKIIGIVAGCLALISLLIINIFNTVSIEALNEKIDSIAYESTSSEDSGINLTSYPFYNSYELDDGTLPSDEEYFLYFHQENCTYCKQANAIILNYYYMPVEEGASEYIYDEVPIYFVTPDSSKELFDEYEVDSTPTMIHMTNGSEEERVVGEEDIYSMLNEVVERYYR